MQHNATEVTDQQSQAIDLLISGKTIGCIAEELNIRRETLWRWRQMPAFQQLQHELQLRHREEIRELSSDVLRLSLLALQKEMLDPQTIAWHRFNKALAVLKLFHRGPLAMQDEKTIESD